MKKELDIRKQAIIYTCGNYSRIVLTLIINAVLSRILSSDDFGIAAVIFVFSTLFVTLSDIGIAPAIVQIKELSKREIDGIFSVTVYIAIALMGLFALLSVPIAKFYENDIYIPMGILLSISVFFSITNMVPNGILNKNKRFVFITVRNICIYLVAAVISIIMALRGMGVYSLVVNSVVSSVLTFAVNYYTTRPSFNYSVNFDGFRKIAEFSSFQFAFNIICYLSRNLDNLLTGKYISSSELGFYSKAYTLMLYPINNLTGVFIPVLHPILSEYQKQPRLIYEKYIKIARICFVVGCAVSVVCFICSSEMVLIVYGTGWERTAVCFKWMSIAMIPQMLNSCVGAIYQSIGNTKLLFINSCINVMISVVAIVLGIFYYKSIFYLSICISIAYLFHFFAAHYMLLEYGFHIKFWGFIKELRKEITILMGLILACTLWKYTSDTLILDLVIKGIYIIVVYMILIFITGEYGFIRDIIIKKKSENDYE